MSKISVQDIDWIRLWILNRIISRHCPIYKLIHRPQAEHCGRWNFPNFDAVNASQDLRIEILSKCVEDRLAVIYQSDFSTNHRFSAEEELLPTQFNFGDASFVHDAVVVPTIEGHRLWESEFSPDWSRYWEAKFSTCDGGNRNVHVELLYASDKIFDELVTFFPAASNFDSQFGFSMQDSHTVFGHVATMWKIIPMVKITSFHARENWIMDDQKLKEILSQVESPDKSNKADLKAEFAKRFSAIGSENQPSSADRLIRRISNKWRCDYSLDDPLLSRPFPIDEKE